MNTATIDQTEPTSGLAVVSREDGGAALNAFAGEKNFATAQRMAKALAASTLVPKEYRDNISNILIAIELAARVGASVFMVMQSLDIVHGRPAWRSTFLIATVNACGRFSPIRYQFEGQRGTDAWGCRAVAKDKETGEPCVGALITIAFAKAEGWYDRNGSKWKTMPEQMLMYRAAGFWTRVYAPELSLGMHTVEEVADTGPAWTGPAPSKTEELEEKLRAVPIEKGEAAPQGRNWEAEADQIKSQIAEAVDKKDRALAKFVRDRFTKFHAEAPPEYGDAVMRFYTMATGAGRKTDKAPKEDPPSREPGEEG